jgi:hypothetical protein
MRKSSIYFRLLFVLLDSISLEIIQEVAVKFTPLISNPLVASIETSVQVFFVLQNGIKLLDSLRTRSDVYRKLF